MKTSIDSVDRLRNLTSLDTGLVDDGIRNSQRMHYKQRRYWPVIYIAAGISGLIAAMLAWFIIKVLIDSDTIENPILAVLFLGGLFLIAAGGSVGVFMRKWWGRGILTFVSVLYLVVFPIGTILGFLVLKGLAVHKDEFR